MKITKQEKGKGIKAKDTIKGELYICTTRSNPNPVLRIATPISISDVYKNCFIDLENGAFLSWGDEHMGFIHCKGTVLVEDGNE